MKCLIRHIVLNNLFLSLHWFLSADFEFMLENLSWVTSWLRRDSFLMLYGIYFKHHKFRWSLYMLTDISFLNQIKINLHVDYIQFYQHLMWKPTSDARWGLEKIWQLAGVGVSRLRTACKMQQWMTAVSIFIRNLAWVC